MAGLAQLLGRGFSEAKGISSDFALLAALDARRAAIRLAWLLGGAVIVGVLVVTAWLVGVAAGIVYLLGEGVPWEGALLIGAAINVAVAAGLAFWLKGVATELPFTALLRQLRGEPAPGTEDPRR